MGRQEQKWITYQNKIFWNNCADHNCADHNCAGTVLLLTALQTKTTRPAVTQRPDGAAWQYSRAGFEPTTLPPDTLPQLPTPTPRMSPREEKGGATEKRFSGKRGETRPAPGKRFMAAWEHASRQALDCDSAPATPAATTRTQKPPCFHRPFRKCHSCSPPPNWDRHLRYRWSPFPPTLLPHTKGWDHVTPTHPPVQETLVPPFKMAHRIFCFFPPSSRPLQASSSSQVSIAPEAGADPTYSGG